MIDENEFFRNATLRICGNLEVEQGLRACVEYLAEYLPGDRLYLQRNERTLGAMRFVARARPGKGESMDLLVPFSEEAKAIIAGQVAAREAGTLPPVLVINEPREDPVTCDLLDALGEPPSSVMALPLIVESQINGALVLLAEGDDRFNEDHARLFCTLREPFFVAMSNALRHQEVVLLKDRLADDNRFLSRELQRMSGDEIVGADFGLKAVMGLVRQVAPTESPVLLGGETGVGKDVVANAIHRASPRRNGPFIAVNCGAIPESLLDSELFGHEKGAFTGALAQKRGRFERAGGGTIFLDEVGEMPLEAQVRLLRVLQNREIERIGGTGPISVDIRIIAATNKNLEQQVRAGLFREDLWFRLNVFPIWIPSLRDRTVDIPSLVQHFLVRKARELKLGHTPELAPGAMDTLLAYHWPGNVRELENLVERAMIICGDQLLNFDLLGSAASAERRSELTVDSGPFPSLDEVMGRHIHRALEVSGGKVHGPGGAGQLLGVNANTLRHRMRKLGVPFGRG